MSATQKIIELLETARSIGFFDAAIIGYEKGLEDGDIDPHDDQSREAYMGAQKERTQSLRYLRVQGFDLPENYHADLLKEQENAA